MYGKHNNIKNSISIKYLQKMHPRYTHSLLWKSIKNTVNFFFPNILSGFGHWKFSYLNAGFISLSCRVIILSSVNFNNPSIAELGIVQMIVNSKIYPSPLLSKRSFHYYCYLKEVILRDYITVGKHFLKLFCQCCFSSICYSDLENTVETASRYNLSFTHIHTYTCKWSKPQRHCPHSHKVYSH